MVKWSDYWTVPRKVARLRGVSETVPRPPELRNRFEAFHEYPSGQCLEGSSSLQGVEREMEEIRRKKMEEVSRIFEKKDQGE